MGVWQVALYPGSFDPVHNGHLAIIAAASPLFDGVVVAIGYNPGKAAGMFSGPDRADLVRESLAPLELPNVRVTTFTGLVTAAARDEGADCLLKGHSERHRSRRRNAPGQHEFSEQWRSSHGFFFPESGLMR